MSNYPTLVQNTLDGFSETASELYIHLMDKLEGWNDRENERRCLLLACHYEENCGATLDYILTNGPFPNITKEVKSDLSAFFAVRWQNNFMEQK